MVSLVFLFKVNTQIMYLCKVKIKRLKKNKNETKNTTSCQMIGQNNNKNPQKVLYTGMKVCHQHGNSGKSKLSMFPKLFQC